MSSFTRIGRNTAVDRPLGMGGSDAPASLRIHPWRSVHALWREKRCRLLGIPVPPSFTTWQMRAGQALQPAILERYARGSGRRVEQERSILLHADWTVMFASIDGWQFVDGEVGVIEAKLVLSVKQRMRWQGGPPIEVQTQLRHYMECADTSWGTVAAMFGFNGDIVFWDYRRDRKLGSALVEHERRFWRSVILGDPPARKRPERRHRETDGDGCSASVPALWSGGREDGRDLAEAPVRALHALRAGAGKVHDLEGAASR